MDQLSGRNDTIYLFPERFYHHFFVRIINMHANIHYDDVIMGTIASQITSLTIVYSTVYSGADQSKHQSSASLAFVWGIHRGPVNSPHKWPVTRKMFPFDDVIMYFDNFIKVYQGLFEHPSTENLKLYVCCKTRMISNFSPYNPNKWCAR